MGSRNETGFSRKKLGGFKKEAGWVQERSWVGSRKKMGGFKKWVTGLSHAISHRVFQAFSLILRFALEEKDAGSERGTYLGEGLLYCLSVDGMLIMFVVVCI